MSLKMTASQKKKKKNHAKYSIFVLRKAKMSKKVISLLKDQVYSLLNDLPSIICNQYDLQQTVVLHF